MNWYKHYIGDYQRCTNRLTIRQDGVYRRLLDEYYATEQPLPTDHQECYRAVRAMTPDEQADVDLVLTRYFDRLSDGYHNKKCDEMIAKAEAQATTNRRIAKQRTVTKPSNEPSNEPLHEQPTYQTPDTRHQTKEPPIAPQGGHESNVPRETKRVKLTFAQAIEASPGLKTGCITKAKRLFAEHGWPEINFDLVWEEFERYWTGDGARKKKLDWPGTFYNRAMECRTRAAYRLDFTADDAAKRIAEKYAARAQAEKTEKPEMPAIPDFLRRTA